MAKIYHSKTRGEAMVKSIVMLPLSLDKRIRSEARRRDVTIKNVVVSCLDQNLPKWRKKSSEPVEKQSFDL
jgi:hypothetical protein